MNRPHIIFLDVAELEATLVPPPIEVEGPKPDDDDNFLIWFPWKRDSMGRDQGGANVNAKPGEYVLQTLFLQFCSHAERKIEQVLAEPLVSGCLVCCIEIIVAFFSEILFLKFCQC